MKKIKIKNQPRMLYLSRCLSLHALLRQNTSYINDTKTQIGDPAILMQRYVHVNHSHGVSSIK